MSNSITVVHQPKSLTQVHDEARNIVCDLLLGGIMFQMQEYDKVIATPDVIRQKRKDSLREYREDVQRDLFKRKVDYLNNCSKGYVNRYRMKLYWPENNVREEADYVAEQISFGPLLSHPSVWGTYGINFLYAMDDNAWFRGIRLIKRSYIMFNDWAVYNIEHISDVEGFKHRVPINNNTSYLYIDMRCINHRGEYTNDGDPLRHYL